MVKFCLPTGNAELINMNKLSLVFKAIPENSLSKGLYTVSTPKVNNNFSKSIEVSVPNPNSLRNLFALASNILSLLAMGQSIDFNIIFYDFSKIRKFFHITFVDRILSKCKNNFRHSFFYCFTKKNC